MYALHDGDSGGVLQQFWIDLEHNELDDIAKLILAYDNEEYLHFLERHQKSFFLTSLAALSSDLLHAMFLELIVDDHVRPNYYQADYQCKLHFANFIDDIAGFFIIDQIC